MNFTCPATDAAHKPRFLTHIEAAALPVVALTAWQALFDDNDTVIIMQRMC